MDWLGLTYWHGLWFGFGLALLGTLAFEVAVGWLWSRLRPDELAPGEASIGSVAGLIRLAVVTAVFAPLAYWLSVQYGPALAKLAHGLASAF